MKKWIKIALVVIPIFMAGIVQSQQRFPKPEFESGYEQPSPETPEPRSSMMEYFDVMVLLFVLAIFLFLYILELLVHQLFYLLQQTPQHSYTF